MLLDKSRYAQAFINHADGGDMPLLLSEQGQTA